MTDDGAIRPCRDQDRAAILQIVNAAAEAYRGVIPADRWHEPYMSASELDHEIAEGARSKPGARFWGYELGGALIGIMGVQAVEDVDLIRHAYVLPDRQRGGVGAALLDHLRPLARGRMLVGTWADADWAIGFYARHGFALVAPHETAALLARYWTIPERQVETSVVLADPPYDGQA